MKLFSKDGIEMMDVRSVESKGDLLVLKGKMMGSMAATIHIRPEELWQAVGLLLPVFWRLPVLLAKGFLRSRKKAAAPQSHPGLGGQR